MGTSGWSAAGLRRLHDVLAGHVAAGEPAESFYRQRIFGPLGMTDTGFSVPAAQLGRLVPAYTEAGGAGGAGEVAARETAWARLETPSLR